jgi:hypothetical protein
MAINRKLIEKDETPPVEQFEVIGPWSGNANQRTQVSTSFPVDYVFHRDTGYSSHSAYSGQSGNLLNQFASEATWTVNNSDRVGFATDYLDFHGNWARNNYSGYYGFCFASSRTGVTNTDGTLTSTVWANDSAGFSFVRWSGNDSTGSVGHGLSQAPDVVWCYPQDYADEITVATPFDSAFGPPYYMNLTTNNYANYGADRFPSNPSSTVINLGAYNNGNDYTNGCTAACWYEKPNYSYFRRYTGGCGAAKSINIGFEPAGVIIKSFSYNYPWRFVSYSGQHGVTFTSTGISMPANQTYVNQCGNYLIMAWKKA